MDTHFMDSARYKDRDSYRGENDPSDAVDDQLVMQGRTMKGSKRGLHPFQRIGLQQHALAPLLPPPIRTANVDGTDQASHASRASHSHASHASRESTIKHPYTTVPHVISIPPPGYEVDGDVSSRSALAAANATAAAAAAIDALMLGSPMPGARTETGAEEGEGEGATGGLDGGFGIGQGAEPSGALVGLSNLHISTASQSSTAAAAAAAAAAASAVAYNASRTSPMTVSTAGNSKHPSPSHYKSSSHQGLTNPFSPFSPFSPGSGSAAQNNMIKIVPPSLKTFSSRATSTDDLGVEVLSRDTMREYTQGAGLASVYSRPVTGDVNSFFNPGEPRSIAADGVNDGTNGDDGESAVGRSSVSGGGVTMVKVNKIVSRDSGDNISADSFITVGGGGSALYGAGQGSGHTTTVLPRGAGGGGGASSSTRYPVRDFGNGLTAMSYRPSVPRNFIQELQASVNPLLNICQEFNEYLTESQRARLLRAAAVGERDSHQYNLETLQATFAAIAEPLKRVEEDCSRGLLELTICEKIAANLLVVADAGNIADDVFNRSLIHFQA
jgi:hypothetical protein